SGRKVAIVTGANRGLGRVITHELGSRGVHVVVTSRQHEAASRVAAEITEAGGSATSFACDVSNDEAVADLVDDTVANHGRVDILVNNAGVIEPIASIGSVDPTAWRHALGVNLTGAFHAIQA